MGWADGHVAALARGEPVQFRPVGNSMRPRIESGQLVTVRPATAAEVEVGDVVLCRVGGRQLVHLVAAKGQDGRVQIANARGHVNGWTAAVYGRVIAVAP